MTIGDGDQGVSSPLLPESNDQRAQSRRGSSVRAVFNLSTTIIGAGMMALPAAMNVLGLIPGIVIILLVALLTDISIEILMKVSRAGQKNTYFAVMEESYPWIGRKAVQISVVIGNLGVSVIYMIIIGDVLSGTSVDGIHHNGLLEEWFGTYWWNSRAFVLFCITLLVFVPLARHKRVDSLGYTSAAAVALALVFVIVTAGIAIYKLVDGSIEKPRLFPEITDWASIWKLFTAFPVIVTAYVCHFNVHSIEDALRNPSKINLVVRTSLLICSVVYVSTSFFAYLLFGDSTLGDVLANFDTDLGVPYSSFLNAIVRISYVVHIMLVFPVIFFSLRLNFDGLIFPHPELPLPSDKPRFVRVSLGLLAVTYLTAILLPSIWDAFQIIGATTSILIGFIFPAAIVLRDVHGVTSISNKILSVAMIVLAVFSSMVALYSDFYSIFTRKA